jgi:hypothetical protein
MPYTLKHAPWPVVAQFRCRRRYAMFLGKQLKHRFAFVSLVPEERHMSTIDSHDQGIMGDQHDFLLGLGLNDGLCRWT